MLLDRQRAGCAATNYGDLVGERPYRVAFLQTVMLGNANRYRVLRAAVNADPTVDATWVPLRSWVFGDWLRVLPGWARVRVRHLLDAARLFMPLRVDAVVVHAPEMWGVYGTFHRLFRRRALLVEHSDAPLRANGRLAARLHRYADQRADLFLPWTSFVAEDIRRRIVDRVPEVHVVAPGVDTTMWSQREQRRRAAEEPVRVLFVGGEPGRKGIATLLEAMRLLGPGYRLDVATQARNLDDGTAAEIAALPGARVHLDLGPDSRTLRELYGDADVFALPTTYDTYGFAFVEALATGIPVVATPVGGVPDVVIDGTSGVVVQPDDAPGVAAAIRSIGALGEDDLARLVASGRRHAELHHDSTTNASVLLRIIKAKIDEQRRHREARPSWITRSTGVSTSCRAQLLRRS
jgi:glycosyltransferase involved in cell wall biosynthesis